jgi:pimeloyl-ACP methyl ester carboxylesterase
MLSTSILEQSKKLTETTSCQLFHQIQFHPLATSLVKEPILTSYVKLGENQVPLLLLHGFDSSLLEYRRLIPLLSHQHQVWAMDLLGFGFTERHLNLTYSPTTIKTHLYSFWQTLIQEPIILVGASMGGTTAIDFTLSYPQVVKQLILIDSGGLVEPPIISKFIFPPLDYLATGFLRNLKVRQNISKNAYFDPRFANEDALICAALHLHCANWRKALISFSKSGGYGSYAPQLEQIQQPTLIIWGENDKILGTKFASQFAAAISHSKLVWIKECGHVPHLEKPEITANYILEFTAT